MHYWDITYPLQPGMQVWPGDPELQIQRLLTLANGDDVNSSLVTFGTHTGTHIDAPAHVFPGQQFVESIPLEVLIGPVVVIDCCGYLHISAALLERLVPVGTRRLLIKTSVGTADQPGSIFPYSPLTGEAGEWLVDQNLLLLGLSSPSVDSYESSDLPVHRILLQAGIVIVERLSLGDVPDGRYQLYCLPLPLVGADGAPVRAVLIAD